MAYLKLLNLVSFLSALVYFTDVVNAGNLIAAAAGPAQLAAYSPATAVSSQYLHRAIPATAHAIAAPAPAVYATKTISTPVAAVHSIQAPSAVLPGHPYSISQQSISRSFGGNIYSAAAPLLTRTISQPTYTAAAPITAYHHAPPQFISKTAYAPTALTYATAAAPPPSFITKTYAPASAATHYGVPSAYSPATFVAHTDFQGLGVEYHY